MKNHKNRIKHIGQVFTPQFIVDEMLDYINYRGASIINKHIIDNSCGDGAFLEPIVERYCEASFKTGYDKTSIKHGLETYIHGIDSDSRVYQQCIINLEKTAQKYGIENVKWDIYNQSALSINRFNGCMDFVVGNPPYVRVHNLDSSYSEVKQYKFANGGMTDLYLAFFELGFNMLSPNGKLCYITPSSWLNSLAANNMRQYVFEKKNLVSLTDLEHFQPFEGATAYTIISLFANDKNSSEFDYYIFNGKSCHREFCDRLSIDTCLIDSCFYLSDNTHLKVINEVKSGTYPKSVLVKNGFATLADSVFIGDNVPKSKITIRVLKASTGKWHLCLFPYDKKGKLLPPNIALAEPEVAKYFDKHKTELLKGRNDYPTFYEFGRTQALTDVWKDKIAINTLLRTQNDLKIESVKPGEGVYSGLYIVSSLKISIDDIKKILISNDFAKYVSLLKKYRSGGYYTFNSKDLQQYINHYITHKSDKHYDEQSNISSENPRLF